MVRIFSFFFPSIERKYKLNYGISFERKILEVPDIYEASDIRYKNLRNRLLCKKAISQEDQLIATVKNNMQNNQSLNMSSKNPVESNDSSFCEEMDWEPMEDEKITFEVVPLYIRINDNITFIV